MPENNKTDEKDLFEILLQPGKGQGHAILPVSLYKAMEIEENNTNFPNSAKSDFHKDEKYWCTMRPKVVSQVSNQY
jgi:hypothetical protein